MKKSVTVSRKLLIAASNHMDPSWRRAFIEHFNYKGGIVRPYSDIEDRQISIYFDFAEKYGMKFSIEQTISIKTFLERNPDLRERFAALVKAGQIEIMGGGETVVDVNLVCGESIVRNQYYAIKYCKREFGVRPTHANVPDVFGLSAQLPQIFRQLGYYAVHNISRVRDDNPPYWRGLDGTLIYADEPGTGFPGEIKCMADFGKYPPCPACAGEGCDCCFGSGFDISHTFSENEKKTQNPENQTTEEFLSANEDMPELLLTYFSEETTHSPDYIDYIMELAGKHNRTVEFLSYNEVFMYSPVCRERYNNLKNGKAINESDIDVKTEYNPMAAGCYTSRVELKKQNRELEALLIGTETLSALAQPAESFPHRTLELLWNKMAFLQFHDCITGTHTDASYSELLRYCREIRFGAMRLREAATAALAARVSAVDEYGTPFILFNPNGGALAEAPLRAVICRDAPQSVEVFDITGRRCEIIEQVYTAGSAGGSLSLRFISDLPPLGYSVFFYRPAPAAGPAALHECQISNEFYRVTEAALYDTEGTPLILGSLGALRVSSDYGHAWGRTKPEGEVIKIDAGAVRAERGDGCSRLIFTGSYKNSELEIKKLDWTTTVTLIDGNRHIFVENALDWDGVNRRITADFPLAGNVGEDALYDIPFGAISRDASCAGESDKELGFFDEWPALGYFGAHDAHADRSFIVYPHGLCGARLWEGSLQLSLLRSPGDAFYSIDNDGVRETGKHVSQYAIEVCSGSIAGARPAHFAAEFGTQTFCAPVLPGERELPMRGSLFVCPPENTLLSALKRDLLGNLILRAYEPYGKPVSEDVPEGSYLCDMLEENEEKINSEEIQYRPFEIKTIKIKGGTA